jgi:uncharacterized protein
MPEGFGERSYQRWIQSDDLCTFRVNVRETELLIRARADLFDLATRAVAQCRSQIETYLVIHPEFASSLTPLDVEAAAPPIIRAMAAAARQADVGPFAAVAGAIAEQVGRTLLADSPEVIVENGGDVFLAGQRSRVLGIYAGASPFTGRLALKIEAAQLPCGVCSSSGTVGHSLSFGKADAVIVLAQSTALADACATALANRVSTPADIDPALAKAADIPGIAGAVMIVGSQIGAWGAVQLVKMAGRQPPLTPKGVGDA